MLLGPREGENILDILDKLGVGRSGLDSSLNWFDLSVLIVFVWCLIVFTDNLINWIELEILTRVT